MTNDVFFSIVIPTYNRATFLLNAINSVLLQTYENFEVIVVDDASTDNTAEVMRTVKDPRVFYYQKKVNEERAAARNFGARKAKGHYINFLDSDDYFYPDHLAEARNFLLDHHDTKIFHLAYDVRDEKGKIVKVVRHQKPINHNIIFGNTLSCNGVVVERQTILENPFNEELTRFEDWELWIRMAARFPFLEAKPLTSVIVQHETRSVMMSDVSFIQSRVDLFCKYLLSDEINSKKFGPLLKQATATAKTYAALHIAMTGSGKRVGWRYLFHGVSDSVSQLFTRRFIVTVLLLLGLRKPR